MAKEREGVVMSKLGLSQISMPRVIGNELTQ